MSLNDRSFSERLLAWFDDYGRHDLPWQHPVTPYRVWVSEVMLQQTQVSTVIPYFERFMAQFPNVESLAAASTDQVLALWSGLGYYARGRNLHKASQIIVRDYQALLPQTAVQLTDLPGIGLSTAHAILSIAYQQPTAICDGNVKRVLSRWLALDMAIELPAVQAQLWQSAQAMQSHDRPRDYTQAIMDLGATLCTRTKPRCGDCPVAVDCRALISGRSVVSWPIRNPKSSKPVKAVSMWLIVRSDGAVWLNAPQQHDGIWGGLYQLPQHIPEDALARWQALPVVKHVFTHMTWMITPYVVSADDMPSTGLLNNGLWYNPASKSQQIAMPAVVDKLIHHWLQQGSSS